MTGQGDKNQSRASANRDDDPSQASDGDGFESWLRQAARAPGAEPRVPLPQPGQVIGGKYRIEEQLGRGGMGAVYRATHVVSEKQVALKWMLRPASDERAVQRFTREARAAGRIDHPNVVDVYDIGQDKEAGYLVMELLRGESLRARLARGPLTPVQAVDLLLPAMRGVAAAHRVRVIHRDLKPDNIFLCRGPDTSEREAKVLDFGISSIHAPDHDSKTTLTKDGTVLGTPAYMSPEQLESSKHVDARTDVYAFGVILYEALTGSVPFSADSYSALVLAIVNTAPKPPRELRPEIPPALEAAVLQAMAKDRAARTPTMDALIASLLPFASAKSAGSGEHVSLEMQRATLPSMRTQRTRAIAISVVLVALCGLAWFVLRAGAPPDAPVRARVTPADAKSAVSRTEHATPPAPSAETTRDAPAAAAAPAPPGVTLQGATSAETAKPSAAPEPPSASAPAGVLRTKRVSDRFGHERPAAPPTTAAQPKPAPSRSARSGSISVEDL